MVYTQDTSFGFDWKGRNHRMYYDPRQGMRPVIIRNNEHEIAGTYELSHIPAQRLQHLHNTHVTFIILSTGS
jgi:hypothetical protein